MLPLPGGEGVTEKMLIPSVWGRAFSVAADGIYFIPGPGGETGTSVRFYRFSTGKTEEIAPIPGHISVGLSVIPGANTIFYSGYTRYSTNVMLVENFR
jgi:hypothetical protein